MAESSPAAVPESIENEVSVSSFVAIKAIGGFQRVETKLCFLFTAISQAVETSWEDSIALPRYLMIRSFDPGYVGKEKLCE